MRRVFHFLGRLAGALLLLGVPAALGYLHWIGFGEAWRAKVANAIGGSVLEVDIGKLTLNPFHGIVAEDVSVLQRAGSRRRLADIDRLVVSLSLAELLRGKVNIDLLELEHTAVSIPFAEDGQHPDVIELSNLSAEIHQAGGRLTISRGGFDFQGIRVMVSGELLNADARPEAQESSPEDDDARVAAIRSVLGVLDEIRFSGDRPTLVARVTGDLADPASLAVPTIEFRAAGVEYRGADFGRIEFSGSYADRSGRLSRLSIHGPAADLTASGTWSAVAGGDLAVSGRVSAVAVLGLMGRGEAGEDVMFEKMPEIDSRVTFAQGDSGMEVSVTGRVATGPFSIKGVALRNLTAAFAWKDSHFYVQDALIESLTGTVRASVLSESGGFRMKLDSDAIPTEFAPFFGPNERKILDLMEFRDAPRVTMKLAGEEPKMDAISGTGTIELGRTAMRGSWIDSARSSVVIEDRAVRYEDFTVKKGDRQATGAFTYDFGRREVRLDDVRSRLNPAEVLLWVDPNIAATVAVYRFRGAPDVRADGLVHMEDPSKNDLRVQVDAPGGLDYELLNKDLPFGATQAQVRLKGTRVRANVTKAKLMGGEVAVDADVSTEAANPSFGASVSVAGVDFPSLTKLYFGYSQSEGRMSGDYVFTANLRDPGSMKGEGSIRVEDGHVLAIPLFGPLSEIVSAIIPGAGHDSARLATADFAIAKNRISTANLDIEGEGFEMFGEGSIGFPNGDLDMAIRINAKGIPGIVLFPVSKLLEYVSTGTMSDPQWRPKIVPKEFFDVLGMGGNGGGKPKKPPITR